VHGWPFTCGPTFSSIQKPEIRTLAIERIDRTGNTGIFEHSDAFWSIHRYKWLSAGWLDAIYNNIYSHPENPELASAFCKFLRKNIPGWNDATSIRFYAERVNIVPTEQSKNPLEKRLFFECGQ